MDPRKREVEQLEAETARIEQQIAAECVAVGKHVADLPAGSTRSAELAKYFNSVQALRKSEEDFRADISRIRDTIRRVEELETAIAENRRRSQEVAREREARCVELGAGAYSVFKAMADRDRYRPFFDDILRLEREIERLEGDLKALDEDGRNKGLFDKLRSKGRKIVLRGSINKVEKQKLKAYADCGAKVAETDFASHTGGDLRQLFDFAAERRQALDNLARETQRLQEEEARNKETLRKYGIDEDPDRRCEELEKRIGDVRRELEVMYSWMGQLFLEKDLRPEFPDPALAAKYDVVGTMRQNIVRKRQQIHRLKAEIEIDELQKKEKTLRQQRSQLEEERKVKERQLAVKDLEINAGQRRVAELKRVIAGEIPYTEESALPPAPDFYAPKPEEKK